MSPWCPIKTFTHTQWKQNRECGKSQGNAYEAKKWCIYLIYEICNMWQYPYQYSTAEGFSLGNPLPSFQTRFYFTGPITKFGIYLNNEI